MIIWLKFAKRVFIETDTSSKTPPSTSLKRRDGKAVPGMLQRYRSAQSTMASHSPTQAAAVAAVPARHATAAQSRQGLAAGSARSLRAHSSNAAPRRRARRALAPRRIQLPGDRASDAKKGFASFWSSRTARREAWRQLTSLADDGDPLSFLEAPLHDPASSRRGDHSSLARHRRFN